MDYEKKYKNALEWARQVINGETGFIRKEVEEVFPELKESKDENIKQWLIGYFQQYKEDGIEKYANGLKVDGIIAWLEKQGETITEDFGEFINNLSKQFPEVSFAKLSRIAVRVKKWVEKQGEQNNNDKVEPKFKVGDWIIDIQGVSVDQIMGIEYDDYLIKTSCFQFYIPIKLTEKNYRLWTIEDAKDGDVLACGDKVTDCPFIFHNLTEELNPRSYCGVNTLGHFQDNDENGGFWCYSDKVRPATKEQRDQLEKAMADAGYTFDFEKKELKKIEQNPAWSEEDEEMLNNVILDLKVFKDILDLKIFGGKDWREEGEAAYQRYLDWLKSLKERITNDSTK